MIGEVMPTVDVQELFGVPERRPLLLWLLAKTPQEVSALVNRMQGILMMQSGGSPVHVWGMLNLAGKIGISRLHTFFGEAGRVDLDVLSTVQGLEAEFVHQLFNRIDAPKGLTSKDVVMVWGNSLLSKLDRFKQRFAVKILCVDNGPLESLQAKLGPIETIAEVSGQGLKQWIERAAQKHFALLNVGEASDLFADPYFAQAPPVLQPALPLRGLSWAADRDLIENSLCAIPPLRSTLAREQAMVEDDDEMCSNDGQDWVAPKERKTRPATPALTAESLAIWAAKNLKVQVDGKLRWARLKDLVEEAFKAGKPSDALLKSAGLGRIKVKGLRLVINKTKQRMVPK